MYTNTHNLNKISCTLHFFTVLVASSLSGFCFRVETAKMCQEQHEHQLPCLHCQPQSYIRMVQNLIENCLVFNMGRDECVKVLAKNAEIDPIVTLTVWKELLKENKSFFEGYFSASSSSTTSTEDDSSTEDSSGSE